MSDRLTFTLHELVAELDAYADGILRRDHGVDFSHFQFLAILSDVAPVDMTTLARCLGVTKAAVSKRVPGLVDGGWIEARSGGGRSILLTLTPRGAALVAAAGAALETAFTDMVRNHAIADPIDVPRLNGQLAALTAVVRAKSA